MGDMISNTEKNGVINVENLIAPVSFVWERKVK